MPLKVACPKEREEQDFDKVAEVLRQVLRERRDARGVLTAAVGLR